jgi:hypothetical protein
MQSEFIYNSDMLLESTIDRGVCLYVLREGESRRMGLLTKHFE